MSSTMSNERVLESLKNTRMCKLLAQQTGGVAGTPPIKTVDHSRIQRETRMNAVFGCKYTDFQSGHRISRVILREWMLQDLSGSSKF